MVKKFRIIVFSILMIGLMGYTGYNYVMYGGARDLTTEKADFTVSSKKVTEEFTKDINKSNKKYLEKAIAIVGKITAIHAKEVTIGNSIICSLTSLDSSIKKDQAVTVKGRVVGYDDLMGELKLDQCSIIKN